MQFGFRQLANPGERFAPDAFEVAIGVPVKITDDNDRILGTAYLVSAKVEEDGHSVFLIFTSNDIDAGDLLVTMFSPELPRRN